MMPQPLDPTYAIARQRFLDSASSADARIDSFPHPLKGLDGEDLAIDIAQLGDPETDSVLLIVSGTHGVAGYVGSALQSWWLNDRASSLPDTAPRMALVHGLNPFAFSWVRRVNEDNVDLNRNFVDWSNPPSNPEYTEIADILIPTEWTPQVQAETSGDLLAIAGEVGLDQFQQIVSGGQYEHPGGVFYGGSEPVWSNRWLVENLPGLVGTATRLAIVDLHTGVGDWGHGALISREPVGAPGYQRGVSWWGDIQSVHQPGTQSSVLTGEWLAAVSQIVPEVELTALAVEYGTVDVFTVIQALRGDIWLHTHGDPLGPEAPAIRARVREAFTDDDPAWLEMVIEHFDEITRAAVDALSS